MSAVDTITAAIFGNPPSDATKPDRAGVIQAFTELYNQLSNLVGGIQSYSTVASLPSDSTAAPVGTQARVYADSTSTNNTYWLRKSLTGTNNGWSIDIDLIASLTSIVAAYRDAAAASAASAASAQVATQTLSDTSYDVQSEIGRGPLTVNYFDILRMTAGSYIISNGTIASQTGYSLSDMMRVKPNSSYYLTAPCAYRYLDGTGAYIASSYGSLSAAGTVTSPATARYMQISYNATTVNGSRLMVVAGSVAPTQYIGAGFFDLASAKRAQLNALLSGVSRLLPIVNLFNSLTTTDNSYLSSNGTVISLAGYFISDYIQVDPSKQFTPNANCQTNGSCWYAEDMATIIGTGTTLVSGTPVTPPAGAAYIRISANGLALKSTFMFVQGTSVPSVYASFPVIDGGAQKRNSLAVSRAAIDTASNSPRQLYNNAKGIDNSAISANGTISTVANFFTTDYTECIPGGLLLPNLGTNAGKVVFYDENNNIVNSGTSYQFVANTVFTTPKGAYSFKASISGLANKATFSVYNAAYATGFFNVAAANASNGDTVTIGTNVITFVTSGATGAQVNIGANNTATAANLLTYINANTSTLGVTASVGTSAPIVVLTATAVGGASNFALATSASSHFFLSAPTMTGGLPASTSYVPFGGSGGAAASTWSGKAWAALGDSNEAQGLFEPYVIAAHGLVLTNLGVSGTKISDPDGTGNGMCTDARINTIPTTAALLTIGQGTNDWAQSIALGTLGSLSTASPDGSTFYGALHLVIRKAQTRCPSARIMLITTQYGDFDVAWANRSGWTDKYTNAQGLKTSDYAEAMRQVARMYSIPVIDWAANNGINPQNVTTYLVTEAATPASPTTDGSHIHFNSTLGAKQAASVMNGRLFDIQPIA